MSYSWDGLCHFHRTGIPGYAINRDFYAKDCRRCEEKLAAGKVKKTDPSPLELRDRFMSAANGGPRKKRRLGRIREVARRGGYA